MEAAEDVYGKKVKRGGVIGSCVLWNEEMKVLKDEREAFMKFL